MGSMLTFWLEAPPLRFTVRSWTLKRATVRGAPPERGRRRISAESGSWSCPIAPPIDRKKSPPSRSTPCGMRSTSG